MIMVLAQPTATATESSEQQATASCLISMLSHNQDDNLYLNATEVRNWVLDLSDHCLTEQDLNLPLSSNTSSTTSSYASTRYAALVSQMACRCHEYDVLVDTTTTTTGAVSSGAAADGVVPCLPCSSTSSSTTNNNDNDNNSNNNSMAAIVVALPGIYPAAEYPGSYAVQACDDILAFVNDVCVKDSVTVPVPGSTNAPTAAPALDIVDTEEEEEDMSTCLIAMLANNVDDDTVLNYAEFLHWMLDLSDGCWSVDDVVRQVHYGTFRDLACLCNNYTTTTTGETTLTASAPPQCLSCTDDSVNNNNNNDPNNSTAASGTGIALPGYYPPGEYPGGYALAVCRQATALVAQLCPTNINNTDTTTSMPSSSPVLDIVVDAPTTGSSDENATAVDDRNVNETENDNGDDSSSGDMGRSEKLILGLVIPLGVLVLVLMLYAARTQLQPQQNGRSFQILDNNGGAMDEEVGAAKSLKVTPIRDDVSVTENTLEPSESQTFDAQGAQLDLVVLPSDVKRQLDELHQTAPYTSSTMRLVPAEEPPSLGDDTALLDSVDGVIPRDIGQ